MTDLRKIARKNRRYYLSEQSADSCNENWFRYIKTMDVYTEPILINQHMARELLDSFNLKRATHPDVVKSVNLSGTHSVTINFSGKLIEGRLILEAILLSESSVVVMVTFNVSDKLNFLFS